MKSLKSIRKLKFVKVALALAVQHQQIQQCANHVCIFSPEILTVSLTFSIKQSSRDCAPHADFFIWIIFFLSFPESRFLFLGVVDDGNALFVQYYPNLNYNV